MKNLRKILASIAIMAAFVAGCQTNSPTPEVVVVKKPDPITPADTTKKDTTKVPPPVSPKVIAGQKCYEARIVAALPCYGIVVQVLNDSIGVKSIVTVIENGKSVDKELINVLTLGATTLEMYSHLGKTGRVYFTVEKFEENIPSFWGNPNPSCSPFGSKTAKRGVRLSSYSNESCKP